MKPEHLFSRQCYPVDILKKKKSYLKTKNNKNMHFKHKHNTNQDECLHKNHDTFLFI